MLLKMQSYSQYFPAKTPVLTWPLTMRMRGLSYHPLPSHCFQVKDKMLYAATKATVKRNFSSGLIDVDIAATHKVQLDRY